MEETPIRTIRRRLKEIHSGSEIKLCEDLQVMIELIKLRCSHDPDCLVVACHDCRAIEVAERQLKTTGITHTQLMDLRDWLEAAPEHELEGFLADIAELHRPCPDVVDLTDQKTA